MSFKSNSLLSDWMTFIEKKNSNAMHSAVFFSEADLPHPKMVLLQMLKNEFWEAIQKDSPQALIDSIGINVCTLSKFIPEIKEGMYKTNAYELTEYAQKISQKDLSDEKFLEYLSSDKPSSSQQVKKADEFLVNRLADDLINFCRMTGYPMRRMFAVNSIIFISCDMKSIENKFIEAEKRYNPNRRYLREPEGAINKSLDSTMNQWLAFLFVLLLWVVIIYFIVGRK